jgi:hypothetical protein
VEAFLAHDAARAITEKGLRAFARLGEQIAARGRSGGAEAEAERAIHRSYTEARFAFELALESWPEAEDASRGIEQANRAMLAHAIDTDDVALATRLASDVDDAALRAKVDDMRARIAARERELSALREQATLLDDARVARPLGNVFVLAGVAGGAASIPTRYLLARGAVAPITALWTAVALMAGAYALFVLRGGKKSLVSPRVGWTWAAVGLGCLISGVVALSQGEAPFSNAAYTTTMIGIGFVAQALQTRRWLLFAAATMFTGALAMGVFPSRRVEIFGAIWLVSLTGVGLMLRWTARRHASPQSVAPG